MDVALTSKAKYNNSILWFCDNHKYYTQITSLIVSGMAQSRKILWMMYNLRSTEV